MCCQIGEGGRRPETQPIKEGNLSISALIYLILYVVNSTGPLRSNVLRLATSLYADPQNTDPN